MSDLALITARYLVSMLITLLLLHVYVNTRDFDISEGSNALLIKVNKALSILIPTLLLLMGVFH